MHISSKAVKTDSRITALLGPTNTGKTHYAIEHMATYPSGIIGFPLRLLARENYDRLVALKGPDAVALVTGEEKIIPRNAKYFSCTVESMPMDLPFDFLAVDEIHLCSDPERGHVFTERLLAARGTQQTMFMGSDVIRPLLASLVPGSEFMARPRLSQLTYAGYKKLTRLPKRTAVVAFSIEDVYAIAELIRRQKGGTAVVLGALSPRTRNKQVEMYQNGEVDFLVATDAIGMGLNMDIHHVALAATRKYDGQYARSLDRVEIAQIAGRAGRYMRDGTFGVTGRVQSLDEDTVKAIEEHDFESLRALYWRNSVLDFATPRDLLASLDRHSGTASLVKGRPADDYQALAHMLERDDVMVRASDRKSVELLWEVCQIPDFRRTLTEKHQELVANIYVTLMDKGVLPEDAVQAQIGLLDRPDGDVDTLMARIAHIRTWTYITHKSEWLRDAAGWAEKARKVEDRLSDALHEGLTKRFVDRRSAVLMRAMEGGAELLAGVRENGEVVVEGHVVGRLEGFRFIPDEAATGSDYKAVMTAARNALKPEIGKRVYLMQSAIAKQFKLDQDGQVLFQTDASNPLPGQPVARIKRGQALLQPDIEIMESVAGMLDEQNKAIVGEKLREWLKVYIATVLEPLAILAKEEGIEGTARGIAFQLHEALGIIPRAAIEELIAGLDDAGRAALRARKVRLGPVLVFLPSLNKPASVRLRALLWSLWNNKDLPASVPHDGVTSVTVDPAAVDPVYYRAIGYPVYGPRAIRVDMLDRLISAVYDNAKDGKFQATHSMAEGLGCSVPVLYEVLEAMGHTKISDPATAAPAPAADKPAGEIPAAEAAPAAVEAPVVETSAAAAEPAVAAEAVPAKATPAAKPELATFRLRRGKAYGGSGKKPPPFEKLEKKTPPPFEKLDKKDGKSNFKKDRKPRDKDRPRRDSRDKGPDRVVSSAKPKTQEGASPFAVLQGIKLKSKDGQ